MAGVVITHSWLEGSVLDGTVKGDGAAEVVKALGWRWGRSIGRWYLPRSRGKAADVAAIESAAASLRAAGFVVETAIEQSRPDQAELEADERAEERSLSSAVERGDEQRAATVTERLAEVRAQLEHWRGVRARQLADGVAGDYSPATVAVGDAVRVRGQWYLVERANAKSVTVRTALGTRRAPWHGVSGHRPGMGLLGEAGVVIPQ